MFRQLARRDTRPLVTLLALVLVPGLMLAYVGLRGVAERENSLRTQYAATAALVRDRLAAEIGRREESLWRGAALDGRLSLAAPSMVAGALETLEHDNAWVTHAVLIDGDTLAAGSLRLNWPGRHRDPLADISAAAALVAAAERAEFVQGNLDTALNRYREAHTHAPRASAAAAFLLTRTGRTLLKMHRPASAITAYRQALADAGDAADQHGLPYAVIALTQIGDALAALGRTDDKARADRELLDYIVNHPWDLADGFGVYLRRTLADARDADPDLLARGRTLASDVADLAWLKRDVMPRIDAAGLTANGADDDSPARLVVERDGRQLLAGFRSIDPSRKRSTLIGYTARPERLADEVLAGMVSGTADDDRLVVRLIGPIGAGALPETPLTDALAAAPFSSALPGWQVVIFDSEGRSIRQLVARERWTYGALVAGMLAVMAAGLVIIGRTSRRATELSRAKTEFVANVSHELKTPLALIRMFGETLESGIVADDERRREFAGVIRRESERLTHLINNVLDLGRIDAGTKQYALVPGDVVETVREALDAYRPLFERLGFHVEADLPHEPIAVKMDRHAIVQSLVNLFQNVIKYSHGEAYVRVRVVGEGDCVGVSVTDRGAGIAPEEIARIFDPYYRAAAQDSAPAGSGLGLSIVRHAVAAHGGRVDVASTPGAGSTFTLVLPVFGGPSRATDDAAMARAEA
jgi:signal transduction histidine kinase/tetratricopeptide (TPR) repeat protein